MENSVPLATFSLVAFLCCLVAIRGEKLPVPEVLRLIESNGREAAMLVALGLFLGFLLKLP